MIAQTRVVAVEIEKLVGLRYMLGTEWTEHVKERLYERRRADKMVREKKELHLIPRFLPEYLGEL